MYSQPKNQCFFSILENKELQPEMLGFIALGSLARYVTETRLWSDYCILWDSWQESHNSWPGWPQSKKIFILLNSLYLCTSLNNFLSRVTVPYLALPFNLVAICSMMVLKNSRLNHSLLDHNSFNQVRDVYGNYQTLFKYVFARNNVT